VNETEFDAFLERTAPGAAGRERRRELLDRELAELKALGFGRLRVPARYGGDDIPLERLFSHLIRLASADPSLGHVWRGHVAFVESLRLVDDRHAERWFPRVVGGDFIGNAQSERQDTARITTRIERDGPTPLLSGTKYYTTGSIYADWIHLAALDGDDRVAVTVSARQQGVESIDDWDGFGQLLTGSGTTTFTRVPVDPQEITAATADPARGHQLGAVFQLALLAVIAGIAQRALDDAIAFVRPRRRTFGFAGETLPREDPLVQLVVGELSVAASASRRLVLSAAADIGAAVVSGAEAGELERLKLEVFRLQEVVPSLVLGATNRLFEVGGASALSTELALDRHWRNARTVASHNPVIQRTAAVGRWELDGTLPDWKAPGA
jgi:alkylation response protein AidB-like acyl-CoA dehydrogenase